MILKNYHFMSQRNYMYFWHQGEINDKILKKTKTETEVLTKTIKGAIKIDADLTKKVSNKGINYEKVLKQYQELLLTISKIQEKQSKLVEIYKEFQSSSEYNLSQGFSGKFHCGNLSSIRTRRTLGLESG